MKLAPTAVVDAPRRKPGRGSQVTPAERREIQHLHLVDGLNQKQIAAQTGRTRETIAAQLRDEDFQALKRQLDGEMAEEARSTLKRHVKTAARDWIKASSIAAKRGDHKPAKDLLLHAGAIERLGDTSRSQVQILITTADVPSQEVIDAEEARVLALRAPSQEVIDAEEARVEALRAGQAAHASRPIDVVAQPAGAIGVSEAGAIDGVPQPSRAIDGRAQPMGGDWRRGSTGRDN